MLSFYTGFSTWLLLILGLIASRGNRPQPQYFPQKKSLDSTSSHGLELPAPPWTIHWGQQGLECSDWPGQTHVLTHLRSASDVNPNLMDREWKGTIFSPGRDNRFCFLMKVEVDAEPVWTKQTKHRPQLPPTILDSMTRLARLLDHVFLSVPPT